MIKIVTDSTSDLPADLVRQYNLSVVPLYLIWGDQQFIDNVSITKEAFFARLPLDPVAPTTSQPSVEDFAKVFREAKTEGASEIICVTVAKDLSGTFQSATAAARDSEIKVHVVDSAATTMGLGYQVLAAARALEAGGSVKDALNAIKPVRNNLVTMVGLQTIEYAVRGGRLGGAMKWLGSTFSLKPIITLDHPNGGKLVKLKMQRTQHGLMTEVVKEFIKRLKSTQNLHVAVCHGGDLAVGKELMAMVEEALHPVEAVLTEYGPVLGVHAGPGGFALTGYSE
ncbi:MAG TPA: DegV family protein [Anaerolineaceae bacterium]|nr:DegV family protein [Anaerolineaceae bacterium]